MIKKNDKKGIIWFIPLIVMGGVVGLLALGGYFTGNKLNNIFSQIPPVGWIFIVILLITLMIRRRR